MKSRSISALCGALAAAVLVCQAPGLAQVRKPTGVSAITPADLKEWLSYLASDQLQGRQVYTEGLGLAGAYIAYHLKDWGLKSGGDDGSYFQVVKVLGVNVKRNSSVTVTVNGQTKTFKDGEGVTFPANAGGKQTMTAGAEFVGYGMSLPEANIDDFKGKDVTGKIAIYVGGRGPAVLTQTQNRLLGARARNAIELKHAVAAIGPAGGGRGGGGQAVEMNVYVNPRGGVEEDYPLHAHTRDFLDKLKAKNRKTNAPMEVGYNSALPALLALEAMKDNKVLGWDPVARKSKVL